MTTEQQPTIESLSKDLAQAQRDIGYWKERSKDNNDRSDRYYEKYSKATDDKKTAQAIMGVLILVCIGLLISLAAILSSTVLGQMLIGVLVAFVAAGAAFLLFHMIRDNL